MVCDGFGGATQPDVLRWLAGPHAETGAAAPERARRSPASARERGHRRDVQVYADDSGRLELAVELFKPAAETAAGHGRRLIGAGLASVAHGTPVWAHVSPGNARSVRAFLACGFVPICSEVIVRRAS